MSRLAGFGHCDGLKDAGPGTLRYRIWPIPARLARHARQRTLKSRTTCHRANRNQTPLPKPGTTQSVIKIARTSNH